MSNDEAKKIMVFMTPVTPKGHQKSDPKTHQQPFPTNTESKILEVNFRMTLHTLKASCVIKPLNSLTDPVHQNCANKQGTLDFCFPPEQFSAGLKFQLCSHRAVAASGQTQWAVCAKTLLQGRLE